MARADLLSAGGIAGVEKQAVALRHVGGRKSAKICEEIRSTSKERIQRDSSPVHLMLRSSWKDPVACRMTTSRAAHNLTWPALSE